MSRSCAARWNTDPATAERPAAISTFYSRPRDESAENLRLMEIVDEQFLETPWYGARHMQREGDGFGRYRVIPSSA